MTASGSYLWDNTATAKPITREDMERGFQRMRDDPGRYKPTPHILHPRYEKGEWTRCSCGWWHRLKDGKTETAPVFTDGKAAWPE